MNEYYRRIAAEQNARQAACAKVGTLENVSARSVSMRRERDAYPMHKQLHTADARAKAGFILSR